MRRETVVPIPGLTAACTSSEAIRAAAAVTEEFEAGRHPWQVATDDGCDAAGRSVRWEVRVDLHRELVEAVISIGFPPDDSTGVRRGAVASIRLEPFPADGSELARMALAGEISGRRLRAVWRQQMREREPLPPDAPDSSLVASVVAPEPVRSARLRMTPMRGLVWIVRTPGRTRHLRMDAFG